MRKLSTVFSLAILLGTFQSVAYGQAVTSTTGTSTGTSTAGTGTSGLTAQQLAQLQLQQQQQAQQQYASNKSYQAQSGPSFPTFNGLPATTMDSFVAQAGGAADSIYGDEGTFDIPPMFGFTYGSRINVGITGQRDAGLTTGHGSFMPSAWGADEFLAAPGEWSQSGSNGGNFQLNGADAALNAEAMNEASNAYGISGSGTYSGSGSTTPTTTNTGTTGTPTTGTPTTGTPTTGSEN